MACLRVIMVSLINTDMNGALQIIKKVFPKFQLNDGIVDLVLSLVKSMNRLPKRKVILIG